MTDSITEPVWLGSTKRDLIEAPESVRKTMGGAIRTAQQGGKSDLASPMHGDLRDVMEVRDDSGAGTYRLMYTSKIGHNLYILDFFQKKSKSGSATPQADLERIRKRLKKAREIHAGKEKAARRR
jgi:phage-related protein